MDVSFLPLMNILTTNACNGLIAHYCFIQIQEMQIPKRQKLLYHLSIAPGSVQDFGAFPQTPDSANYIKQVTFSYMVPE